MVLKIKGNFNEYGRCVSFNINDVDTISYTLHHENYISQIVDLLEQKHLTEDEIGSYLVKANEVHQEDNLTYVRQTLEFLIQEKKLIRTENPNGFGFMYSLTKK